MLKQLKYVNNICIKPMVVQILKPGPSWYTLVSHFFVVLFLKTFDNMKPGI